MNSHKTKDKLTNKEDKWLKGRQAFQNKINKMDKKMEKLDRDQRRNKIMVKKFQDQRGLH